jgi:hypothetical protein
VAASSPMAYRKMRFLCGIDIGGLSGALMLSVDKTPSSCPAARRQLRRRGNPPLPNTAGLLCMVAVDGGPLCILAKCEEKARKELKHH